MGNNLMWIFEWISMDLAFLNQLRTIGDTHCGFNMGSFVWPHLGEKYMDIVISSIKYQLSAGYLRPNKIEKCFQDVIDDVCSQYTSIISRFPAFLSFWAWKSPMFFVWNKQLVQRISSGAAPSREMIWIENVVLLNRWIHGSSNIIPKPHYPIGSMHGIYANIKGVYW